MFDPSGGDARLYGSAQTLPGVATSQNLQQYDIGLRPGTSATRYIQTVNRTLGTNSAWQATPPDGGQFYSIAIGAVALNTATIRAMAGTAHTGVPASFTQVFPPSRLALLSLAAIAIAVAGALLPASWAARARPAVALRTE